MEIIVKNVRVKTHHSIRLIKYYYGPFPQVYTIITAEILEIKPKLALQMLLKAFKNLIESNNFLLISLVFGVYLYIIKIDIFLFTITYCTVTMQKGIK